MEMGNIPHMFDAIDDLNKISKKIANMHRQKRKIYERLFEWSKKNKSKKDEMLVAKREYMNTST